MTAGKVYWAGDLFDFKDIIGNRMLADRFNHFAQGRWVAVLPQESESNQARSQSIRDDDLEMLFSCDAVIANFDGTDLDSGTVVEFCFAKFLDLPTVLLRTDFRKCGDQDGTAVDPWNLMCSGYPRTEVLWIHAMKEFRQDGAGNFIDNIARRLVTLLDQCAAEKNIAADENDDIAAFLRAVNVAGGELSRRFPLERIRELVSRRRLH